MLLSEYLNVLTDAQKVALRRYIGFPLFGNQLSPGFGYRYYQQYLLVEYRFNNMSEEEEAVITDTYLPNLTQLEQDIYQVRTNSDTARAAVWYRNGLELAERVNNYNWWRQQLAFFFGVEPINPPGAQLRIMI